MYHKCTQDLTEVHVDPNQSQLLIDAYDLGYEALESEKCPYPQHSVLATNWQLGYEHAVCDGY